MTHINSKICIALTTALSLSIAMVNETRAAEIIKSGCDCGENCCYTLDENGVLTLSRANNRKSANIKDAMFAPMWGNTWRDDLTIKEVTIPEGFTSIGKHAFQDQKISSLTTPNSMETIGESAFEALGSLTSVTLNDGLKEIGSDAFGWTNVDNLILPESVEIVGNCAFCFVDNIIIPSSVNTDDWDESSLFRGNNIMCLGTKEDCLDKLGQYIPSDLGGTCTKDCTNFSVANSEQCKLFANYGWSGASCVRKDDEGKVACASGFVELDNQCLPSSKTTCKNADLLWNGSSCVKSCASGFVEWDNQCLSEYPFAKKRWTPAEAAQWLHDGNDNFVILTFKK